MSNGEKRKKINTFFYQRKHLIWSYDNKNFIYDVVQCAYKYRVMWCSNSRVMALGTKSVTKPSFQNLLKGITKLDNHYTGKELRSLVQLYFLRWQFVTCENKVKLFAKSSASYGPLYKVCLGLTSVLLISTDMGGLIRSGGNKYSGMIMCHMKLFDHLIQYFQNYDLL